MFVLSTAIVLRWWTPFDSVYFYYRMPSPSFFNSALVRTAVETSGGLEKAGSLLRGKTDIYSREWLFV